MKQKNVALNLEKRQQAWEQGIKRREIVRGESTSNQGSKRHSYAKPGSLRRR